MNFEFATATRIVFGPGKRSDVFTAAAGFGSRAFLVTGNDATRADWLKHGLEERGIYVTTFTIPAEPTLDRIQDGRQCARAFDAEFVIGIGGGSAIDGAKAIAALACQPGEISYYLEIIGGAKPLDKPPLPVIAVPTTAGTGAEVTRNSVLLSPEHQLKVSLRSPRMLPAMAIVDPELTYDLPPDLTAATGMDALTQLIEPFVSQRRNPFVDALCREAIPRVARALPAAVRSGHDPLAREEMALGSLFGGLALANAGLGAVHGFAAAIGGMFRAPHGAICAALLPPVLEINDQALRRADDQASITRFAEVARMLTQQSHATTGHAVKFLKGLLQDLRIPPLSSYGLEPQHVALLCSRAAHASSMKGNPIALNEPELVEILHRAL